MESSFLSIMQQSWARVLGATVLLALGFSLRFLFVSLASKSKLLAASLPRWVSMQKKFSGSLDLLLFSLLFHLLLPIFSFSEAQETTIRHVAAIALIISVTWFLAQITDVIEKTLLQRLETSNPDDLRQRRMRTQLQFITKVIVLVIMTIGFASVLMGFSGVRRIGTSLIASAGVASVVVGFAAQKSLSNLIAGFQIAFTQPIRIGDVVVVEGEWGRIEEISLTYVVVKIWDLRRLVLPITYFIEKPFQNWTRTSAAILGSFFLYADYRTPVESVRAELKKMAAATPLWDKEVCNLQVTNLTEHTIELRVVVSSRSAGESFDLKCLLREQLIHFLCATFPDSLPRQRLEGALARATPVAADPPANEV